MIGFIYAIDNGAFVKIGWSKNPSGRLIKIKSDNPGDCELLGVIPGSMAHERELHKKLRPWKFRGEWFRKEGNVLVFIKTLQVHACRTKRALTYDSKMKKRDESEFIKQLRDELIGLANLFKSETDMSFQTIGMRAVNDGSFLIRIGAGAGCTFRRYDKVVNWLRDNWPDNVKWPTTFLDAAQ